MKKNGMPMVPPMFFSSAVDGTPRDGSGTFLSKLIHSEDVAKLVVFDTWIRNWDRYFNGEANSENLLFVRSTKLKYSLVPIDHSNCFIGSDPDFPTMPAPDIWVNDPAVYGKFPEFDDYITAKATNGALLKLSTLEKPFVVEVVNSVPVEWELNDAARSSLVDFICNRATYVVDTLAARLVDEPELPGM
ncbi:hypothetical protein FHT78_003544 [Rhizobium sp. BK196]|nr:HipA family kinase [Rhizobium sp. BK196]MBB3311779.1 hypothetical protein [Rhizobium sp. BK196]